MAAADRHRNFLPGSLDDVRETLIAFEFRYPAGDAETMSCARLKRGAHALGHRSRFSAFEPWEHDQQFADVPSNRQVRLPNGPQQRVRYGLHEVLRRSLAG